MSVFTLFLLREISTFDFRTILALHIYYFVFCSDDLRLFLANVEYGW